MRSLLAASSLAPRLPQPPAPGRPPPLSTERDPPAPGPQAPRLPAARARPRWGLWVPSTALRVSPSLWSGVGWGPTLRPRPHRSSRSGALHTHVLHTLRMPAETASQAGPGGHRALRSALTPGRGQASVLELKSLRPELRAPLGGPDVPQEPPGLIPPLRHPPPGTCSSSRSAFTAAGGPDAPQSPRLHPRLATASSPGPRGTLGRPGPASQA